MSTLGSAACTLGPGPCHLLRKSASPECKKTKKRWESANVDAGGGHEEGGATTPYATAANAGDISISFSGPPAGTPRAPFHHVHASRQTPTASPFFILIYLSQARLILLRAGFDVDTSPPRGEAVLHQSGGGRSERTLL